MIYSYFLIKMWRRSALASIPSERGKELMVGYGDAKKEGSAPGVQVSLQLRIIEV